VLVQAGLQVGADCWVVEEQIWVVAYVVVFLVLVLALLLVGCVMS
jgi:hypothetical protein